MSIAVLAGSSTSGFSEDRSRLTCWTIGLPVVDGSGTSRWDSDNGVADLSCCPPAPSLVCVSIRNERLPHRNCERSMSNSSVLLALKLAAERALLPQLWPWNCPQ